MLRKSKHLCLLKRKMQFGDLETCFGHRYNDIKLVILANMTLNVILTLIALITVALVQCTKFKLSFCVGGRWDTSRIESIHNDSGELERQQATEKPKTAFKKPLVATGDGEEAVADEEVGVWLPICVVGVRYCRRRLRTNTPSGCNKTPIATVAKRFAAETTVRQRHLPTREPASQRPT